MATPEISVVVATRNRARRLEALLDSIAAQRGVDAETVVVDDGSDDDTPAVLARRLEAGGECLKAIRHERSRGPAAARNAGWRAARAPLVAFVDDDCVADPGWLAALAEAHRDQPEAFVQGAVEPNRAELERASVFWSSRAVEAGDAWYATCNIAYPRALLERLGGFDETYRNPAGEDTDLAWRALEAGAESSFAPAARVEHAVHAMGVLGLVRDASRWSDMVRVAKRHPGLRRHFAHRVFWLPSHERAFLLAAGVALARRSRGASLLLTLPYLELYRRHHSSTAGALASLPGYLVGDAAQIAALARGSIRHRTLVL